MNSENVTSGGATCIEDVLAGAMWVSSLTDPSLTLDRLHETFMEVMFSFPAEEKDDRAEGSETGKNRIRTAAELAHERKERKRLLREARELRGEGIVYESGPSDEEDEENLDDYEDEHEDTFDLDREFLDWINNTGSAPLPQPESRKGAEEEEESTHGPPQVTAVELELGRVGLGSNEEAVAADELPERFKEIADAEKRPGLGPRPLPGGYVYKLPLEHEAYWVLRQLRCPGQPLAHNTRIRALANRPHVEIADDPVLVAVSYALERMTIDHVEPAQLMMYEQTPLHPLLCALLDNSPLLDAAERIVPVPSYAYSRRTGRHQRPYVSASYVGFSFFGNRSIGDGDPMWRENRGTGVDYAQRKPCFLELGRLLVRILELDALCHQLEYRRQQMLLMLRDHPEASVQDQRAVLAATVFESAVEAGIWHSFVQNLLAPKPSTALYRLRKQGLDEYYEEFSITALQYQENLEENTPIHLCATHSMPLHDWSREVGNRVGRSGDAIIRLFKDVIVEEFAKLPVLRKRVIDLFCAEGDLIVAHKCVNRRDDVYPIASFLVEHPHQYLDFLHMERQGKVELFYVVDADLVRRILNVNQLYRRPSTEDDDWSREREAGMELLVVHLIDSLVPCVKSELLHNARYQSDLLGVQRLSILCSQGPYEPTTLCLQDYDPEALVWEPEWNVVEALPTVVGSTAALTSRLRSRVCAAYRGDNAVTCFCFIDEYGTVIGSTRWVDCAMNTASGRSAALVQHIQLEKLFAQCTPSVLAVAASSARSLDLMRTLQRFLRERVRVSLRRDVPVVWAAPDVARFCAVTHFADREMPATDELLRTTVGLARSVQDPLNTLCTLFDAKRTVLQLCGTGSTLSGSTEQQATLYRRLCWEMSLWVAGCGMWLDDCARRPNSVAVLQFLGGLGPTRARKLATCIDSTTFRSRADVLHFIDEMFGSRVATSAAGGLRVGPPESLVSTEEYGRSVWHPLDQTLIPLQWYAAATFAAEAALRRPGAGVVAVSDLCTIANEDGKRHVIDLNVPQRELTTKMRAGAREGRVVLPFEAFGEREVELVLEEMTAFGASHLRRPYRRLSTKEMMLFVTGMIFLRKQDAAPGAALTSASAASGISNSFIVREGDHTTGTVLGVRGGASPGVRIATARDMGAFLSAADVPDEEVRIELLEHVRALEAEREERQRGKPSDSSGARHDAPQWLRRGSVIHGIVTGCNWHRCELQVKWCRARDVELLNGSAAAAGANADVPSYAAMVRDVASSVNSLNTVQLERDALIFATKIFRHPLFRDVSNVRANELLRDKEIGEVLLRPASGRYNKAVCVVKVGSNCTSNWMISEERRPNGTVYYKLRDSVVDQTREFEDVDEFISIFIAPMVERVMTIRQHRRFEETTRDVPAALVDQEHNGRTFAYVFAETGQQSKPPLYRVFTRGGGREHRFRLHVTDNSIYVRLPFPSGGATPAQFKWVECRNAEHVSETVKRHAIAYT